MAGDSTPPAQALPEARWPWQRSLQSRILLSYGAVFVGVLAVLMALVGRAVYQAQLSEAQHNLEVEAFLAANSLEDPLSGYASEFDAFKQWEDDREREGKDDNKGGGSSDASQPPQVAERLQFVAATFALDTNSRATILDPRGNAVADSAAPFYQVPNQLQQPEVQAAVRGVEQRDVRVDALTGRQTLYVAAPIQQGEEILGLVQLSQPMETVTAGARALLLRLATAGLLALVMATFLGIGLGRRLVKPVQDMERAAVTIAQGDLGQRVPVETADELGALALAFNQMVDELRRMIVQQRLFVANASHELRTPLTNIKLRSEALLGAARDDPTVARRYLSEIDAEADRLGRLAASLLDLSRLDEAGSARRSAAPLTDILPVVQSILDMIHPRAIQAGLTLTADLPTQLPPLCIWPEDIEAILVNLLENAIKYTRAGGQIRLAVHSSSADCQISVEDSGPGIPAEDLPHVFERFYRVDQARSRSAGGNGPGSGAGLGLSIVKALVEQNDGTIRAESTLGQGTKLVVQLPVSAQEAGNRSFVG